MSHLNTSSIVMSFHVLPPLFCPSVQFSWKQYPELEQYLIENQEEYFEYSLKNYTAEQRKYNNRLTNGLLDLAASLGYVFEDFTFPMIRDRLRCYYKSRKIVK